MARGGYEPECWWVIKSEGLPRYAQKRPFVWLVYSLFVMTDVSIYEHLWARILCELTIRVIL